MLGLIQGVSAAVPLVLFSIPVGILVDRTNRVRLTITYQPILLSARGALPTSGPPATKAA
jgi:hypothetical protein